jgi:hypothetical protein
MTTAPILASSFGKVVGRFIYVVGDSEADPDSLPDVIAASGTATITPEFNRAIVPDEPVYAIAIPRPVTLGIDSEGFVVDETGVRGVWLLKGVYTVSFALTGGASLTSFSFEVKEEHTVDNPLDLSKHAPLPDGGMVQWVVNQQIYDESTAARDEAEAARDAAVQAAETVAVTAQTIQDLVDTITYSTVLSVNGQTGEVSLGVADIAGLSDALNQKVTSVVAGANISVDITDPQNPVISATESGLTSVNGQTGDVVLTADDIGAAEAIHTHTTANITNLDTILSGKADDLHTHDIGDVTNLQDILDGKMNNLVAGANITIDSTDPANPVISSSGGGGGGEGGAVSSVNGQTGDVVLTPGVIGAANATHTHSISQVVGLTTALDSKLTDVTAGVGIEIDYSDPANPVISATGTSGGGGGGEGGAVFSVNGKVGDVVLTAANVGAAASSHTHAITSITGLRTELDGLHEEVDDVASSVLTTKSKISYGSTAPASTTPGRPGDIFLRRSTNDIIGFYICTAGTGTTSGNTWAAQVLTDSVLDSLSTTKLTGTISNAQIATDAVSSAKIADNAIIASHIAAGAVGNSELATDAVTSAKIATNAVGADALAPGGVANTHLATNAVTRAKIHSDLHGAIGISPMEYGAVGDGSANDRTAIMNAITAAAGRIPVIIDRDFFVSSPVTITVGGTTIIGAGGTLRASQVAVGSISGGRNHNTSNNILELHAQNITVHRVHFIGGYHAIRIGREVALQDAPSGTVDLASYFRITENFIQNPFIGIRTWYSAYGVISGNIVTGVRHDGIVWWGGYDPAMSGYPGTQYHCHDIAISNNVVAGARPSSDPGMNWLSAGIWGMGGDRISITGNTVSTFADVGIDLETTIRSVVSGNVVMDVWNSGLALFGASKDILFTGNTVMATSGGGSGRRNACFWIVCPTTRTVEDITLTGNHFEGGGIRDDSGISGQGSGDAGAVPNTRITVNGNFVHGCIIQFNGASHVSITGNTLRDSDIRLIDCDYAAILTNDVWGYPNTSTAPIWVRGVSGSARPVIKGNTVRNNSSSSAGASIDLSGGGGTMNGAVVDNLTQKGVYLAGSGAGSLNSGNLTRS